MKRVLHIFPTFAIGGAQRRFAQIANSLTGFSHHVVSLSGDTAAVALIRSGEVSTEAVRLEKSARPTANNAAILRQLIRKQQPHILCTYNWGSIEAAMVNRLFVRAPHIHFEDGFGPEEMTGTLARRDQFRRLALGSATVVVPSTVLEHISRTRWGVQTSRLHLVANGIDTTAFKPAVEAGRAKDSRIIRVGSVGALRPEKNYPRLIDAVASLGRSDVRLSIVGEGPERPRLVEAAMRAGIDVGLPGSMAEPVAFFRELDIFALSSDTEQMPITVLEAMSCGLPVVATDVGDIAQMVSEPNRPFIVPHTAPGGLRAALGTLVDDPVRRHAIGVANRERAVAQFDVGRMLARFEELFARIVAR